MTPNTVTRVLLFPSGASAWDRAGRLQGDSDIPLADDAAPEIDAVLDELGDVADVTVVLCGPDSASVETAERCAERWGARVRIIDELAEMRLGLWEGLSKADFNERNPRTCKQWQCDPLGVSAPEGESFEQAWVRVAEGLRAALNKLKPGTVSAVVLRPVARGVAQCWMTGAAPSAVWPDLDEPTSGMWLGVEKDRLAQSVSPAGASSGP